MVETHIWSFFCIFIFDHWLEIENFCCKYTDLEIKGVWISRRNADSEHVNPALVSTVDIFSAFVCRRLSPWSYDFSHSMWFSTYLPVISLPVAWINLAFRVFTSPQLKSWGEAQDVRKYSHVWVMAWLCFCNCSCCTYSCMLIDVLQVLQG